MTSYRGLFPWRLHLDDFVLLGALGVLGYFEDHGAIAADDILGSPTDLGVYYAHDRRCPLKSLRFRGRTHAGEADHLSVLAEDLEGPHQPLAELRLLLLDVRQLGGVRSVLKDLILTYIHSNTQRLPPLKS